MRLRHWVCTAVAATSLTAAPLNARGLPDGVVAMARLSVSCGGLAKDEEAAREGGLMGVLAATIIPALVKTGVSAIGAAIQSAASDDRSTPVIATHSNNFYLTALHDKDQREFEVTPQHSCLELIVSSPGAVRSIIDNESWQAAFGSDLDPESLFVGFPAEFAGARHRPHLFARWQINYSADQTAFRLVPERVVVGPALTERQARSRRRDLAISVTMHLPAVKETDGAIGSALMLIPAIAGPITWEGEEAASLATRWWPTPALPQGSADQLKSILQREADILALADDIEDTSDAKKRDALVNRKGQLEDRNLKAIEAFTKPGGIAPFTVQFTVTETRQGSKLVAAMGKVLADQADTIATAVGDRLDPDKRLAAELSAFDKETEARLAAVADVEAWQGLVAENKPASTALQKARRSCGRLQKLEFYVSECNSLPGGS